MLPPASFQAGTRRHWLEMQTHCTAPPSTPSLDFLGATTDLKSSSSSETLGHSLHCTPAWLPWTTATDPFISSSNVALLVFYCVNVHFHVHCRQLSPKSSIHLVLTPELSTTVWLMPSSYPSLHELDSFEATYSFTICRGIYTSTIKTVDIKSIWISP